ncbi:lysophosphatidylserine lipase ABHD12-like isoform X1 [Diorhabda sublineata]|uniref:lysophosphatidylserine lipase ABHD12-like isoform X1 n=1 Tax=Diorhabda sublineata TaxID=1163346 RepID=UPI0024E0D58C|nr:lysophosphatidylserine lipase ABHD12-like isoform X1 [Diorhabda sublineata]
MQSNFRNILINLTVGSIIPCMLCTLCFFNVISIVTVKVLLVISFLLFVILPLIFKFSYKLQTAVLFLNFAHLPYNADYANPHKYGLQNSRNFYLKTDDDITLGVWQILPLTIEDDYGVINETDQFFEEALGDGKDVIIYYHGNAGARLSGHRVELYKILRKQFHVIAFDYRSYGDSTNDQPSETKLVKDCIFIYNWVAERTKGSLFVWGHSLGTSLSLHSLSILQKRGIEPTGVILESPFNNFRDECSEFPLSWMFRFLPWFSYTITEPMYKNGFTFESDKYICNVDAPILILHAQDDHVVPIKLGKRLYEEGKRCRRHSQGVLMFHEFDGKHGYQHKFICRAPEINGIIRDFVSLTKSRGKSLNSSR